MARSVVGCGVERECPSPEKKIYFGCKSGDFVAFWAQFNKLAACFAAKMSTFRFGNYILYVSWKLSF